MELPSIAIAKKTEKSLDFSKVLIFGPSLFAIAVSILIGAIVVWPKYTEAQQLRAENKTLLETATKLETKVDSLARVDSDELRVHLSAAEQLLPSEKSIFTFIGQIEDVRNKSGVVITNLSVGKVGDFSSGQDTGGGGSADGTAPAPPPVDAASATGVPADVDKVTMSVSLSSDFDQIFRFLNDIYALPRVTTVDALSFSIDQDGLISTSMDINSLWQPLPAELASVEAPLPTLDEPELELLAKVESEGAVSSPVVVPDVPKGKANIFSVN